MCEIFLQFNFCGSFFVSFLYFFCAFCLRSVIFLFCLRFFSKIVYRSWFLSLVLFLTASPCIFLMPMFEYTLFCNCFFLLHDVSGFCRTPFQVYISYFLLWMFFFFFFFDFTYDLLFIYWFITYVLSQCFFIVFFMYIGFR